MNAEIKKEIIDVLDKCDGKEYPHICHKLHFVDGKELIVNMVYNKLESFPNWTMGNVLSDVEVTLSGLNDE